MFSPKSIAEFLHRNKGVLAFAVLILLLISSVLLPGVKVTGNLGGFNAKGVKVFEDAATFDSLFGGVRNKVFVSITPKNNSNYDLWKECAAIENEVRKICPEVEMLSPRKFVRSYYGVVDPQHSISNDSLLRALSTHPQLGKLISKDRTSFMLLMNFPNDSIPTQSLDSIVHQPRSQIKEGRIFGLVQLEKAIEETLVKDILWVSLCIAVFFGLFIFHTYRTLSSFVFAIVMMGSSIWMTFCLYPLFGYQITVITILALPIILVLSLSDAIHLLSGMAHEKHVPSLVSKYLYPSLYSSLTTAAAFFSFSFSDSPYIQQLGLLTGVALILEFVVSFSIAPWLLSRLTVREIPPSWLGKVTEFVLIRKKAIAAVLLLIAAGSIFLIPDLKFQSDTDAFFPQNHPVTDQHYYFNEQYYSQISSNVWFENERGLSPSQFLQSVNLKIDQLSKHPLVTHVTQNRDSVSWGEVIPVDLSSIQNPYTHYINPDTSIVRCELHFNQANDVLAFHQQANAKGLLTSKSFGIHVMSNALIYDYINQHIAKTLFYSLLTSGLAIVFMLFVVTRSWKQAFIGLIPNVVPLSIAVWVFSLFGFSLNILTAITATVCIGLLDDDTVHLLYRKFVLREPVDTLANSIVNTAILLAVGFGFFVLSDFYPTQVFGGVSALVFVFGILGELTLFQVVMDWIQLKTRKK